ncbi:hypothetical protein FACS18949_13560 [Clostridia bacterium]|nr:hypothetical protein FACS189425_06270 [Clostridia bacterium]GHV35483.1 hypothetical protein FACS18949_13560 [Clostridia bacterium]
MLREYVTTQGEMWDEVAKKAMGSENYTDLLIKANIDLADICVFPANVKLIIPEKEQMPIVGLPPWKKSGVIYG